MRLRTHTKRFGDLITVEVDNNTDYPFSERLQIVEINWGAIGPVSPGRAKRFRRSLDAAIKYAEARNTK